MRTRIIAGGQPIRPGARRGVASAHEHVGFEDDEHAPAEEMLAAAARIARGVDVPVTVDAEAGYGMEPDALVSALRSAGAAGCNLEAGADCVYPIVLWETDPPSSRGWASPA